MRAVLCSMLHFFGHFGNARAALFYGCFLIFKVLANPFGKFLLQSYIFLHNARPHSAQLYTADKTRAFVRISAHTSPPSGEEKVHPTFEVMALQKEEKHRTNCTFAPSSINIFSCFWIFVMKNQKAEVHSWTSALF